MKQYSYKCLKKEYKRRLINNYKAACHWIKFDRRLKKKTKLRKVLKLSKFLQVPAILIDWVHSFHDMQLVFAGLML